MKRKTNTIFWLIIGLLLPIILFSQENPKSFIYKDNGQLRIDTTYVISQKQFNIWEMSENNIIDIIASNVDYSILAREAGIEGVAIIAFECDTLDLYNIRMVKNIGGGLDENLIEGIQSISKEIVREFRIFQSIRNFQQINYLGTYYIPLEFNLIDLREEIKSTNAITIIDIKIPLNGRRIEK